MASGINEKYSESMGCSTGTAPDHQKTEIKGKEVTRLTVQWINEKDTSLGRTHTKVASIETGMDLRYG